MLDSERVRGLEGRLDELRQLPAARLEELARDNGFPSGWSYVFAEATAGLQTSIMGDATDEDLLEAAFPIAEQLALVYAATDKLVEFGSDMTAPARIGLSDGSEGVRLVALGVLKGIDAKECVVDIERLSEDPSLTVREEVVAALAALGGFQAQAKVLEALEDPDHYVRAEALEALAKTGLGANGEPAYKGLRDPHPDVRKQAAILLRHYDNPEKIPHLVKALADQQYGVAFYAMRGLQHFPDAFDDVCNAIRGKGRYVREMGAQLLAYYVDPRGIPVLEDLAENCPNKAVRADAAKELQKLEKRLEKKAASAKKKAAKKKAAKKTAKKKTAKS